MNYMFPKRKKSYSDENVKKRIQRFFQNVPQCPEKYDLIKMEVVLDEFFIKCISLKVYRCVRQSVTAWRMTRKLCIMADTTVRCTYNP